jgi:succinate dehydrogenase/fumarate reductase cytochrome b subunit
VYTPRVVFIHAGSNNLSKEYLFESENEQLYAAIKQLDALTIIIFELSITSHPFCLHTCVGLSFIIRDFALMNSSLHLTTGKQIIQI